MENAEKKEARRRATECIKALTPEERREKGRAACARLLEVPEVQRASVILLYAPLPDELDIWPALHALPAAGKRVILPKCRPQEHEVICIEIGDFKKDLVRGTFNILEPKSDLGIGLSEIDVAIAPARAFDLDCNRLGRGAGYYDRFFIRTEMRAFKCGISFDCQVFPVVPIVDHDVPVDLVVTESRMILRGAAEALQGDEHRRGEPAENQQGN